jgi:hypothetical protein
MAERPFPASIRCTELIIGHYSDRHGAAAAAPDGRSGRRGPELDDVLP